MSNNNFKFKHFLNGIWTLSMFDDLNVAYRSLKSVSSIYGYLFAIAIVLITYCIGSQHHYTNTSEQIIIYSFIALTAINISSLIYGVYSAMLLIPPTISWLSKISVMGVLLCLFIFCSYTLDKYTKNYKASFKFSILDSLVIGLTGISIIEDIYFLTLNTHILLITLSLPLHLTTTIFTIISTLFIGGTIFYLVCNTITYEAFNKADFVTLLLITIDAVVKTMSMCTAFSCLWFNISILPITYLPLAAAASLFLTGMFSYIYYMLDYNFNLINKKEGLGIRHDQPNPITSLNMNKTNTEQKIKLSIKENPNNNNERLPAIKKITA
ncbi:MAG: hypothetical protein P8L77_04735 [Gammaproteobacteria bacterium]|nr:hypothetical protein [Gammaproteobacteria bacterium]